MMKPLQVAFAMAFLLFPISCAELHRDHSLITDGGDLSEDKGEQEFQGGDTQAGVNPGPGTGTDTDGGDLPMDDGEGPNNNEGRLIDAESPINSGGFADANPMLDPLPTLRIAFYGDHEKGTPAKKVTEMVGQTFRAKIVQIMGDLLYGAYVGNEINEKWTEVLTAEGLSGSQGGIEPHIPVFASMGNHDNTQWINYQQVMEERYLAHHAENPFYRVTCTAHQGALFNNILGMGSMSTCDIKATAGPYEGQVLIRFVLSSEAHGPGNSSDYNDHFKKAFGLDGYSAPPTYFNICNFHGNLREFQTGGKNESELRPLHHLCRRAGALTVTGHEHAYNRSRTLRAIEPFPKFDETVVDPDHIVLKRENVSIGENGKFAVLLNGLGGITIRNQQRCKNWIPGTLDNDEEARCAWWAAICTDECKASTCDAGYGCDSSLSGGICSAGACASTCPDCDIIPKAKHGAVFCDFFYDGTPNKASCRFITIDGHEVVDKFEMTSLTHPSL